MSIFKRLIGVFTLRPQVFENIGQDPAATWQAALIVGIVGFISAVSAAISAVIWGVAFRASNVGLGVLDGTIADFGFRLPTLNGPIPAFLSTFVGAYVSWLLWALVTWLIGEYIFHGDTGFAELARITGYAKAPQILSGLGFIPGVGWIARLVGWVWMLLATFFGVKQGLELSSGKTLLTIILSSLASFVINWFVINPIFARLF
ncbi:MAG: YIP1 family protein [Candidatus Promineifilaceae bacterium]